MKFRELQKRLESVGADVLPRTLHNWEKAGLITSPELKKRRRGRRGRPSYKYVKTPGPNYERPDKALYEAAACWAVKHQTPFGDHVPNETLKRVKVLAEEFFINVHAVDWREDFAPDGTADTYFSSYDVHTLFVAYMAAYEKAVHGYRMRQRVKVKYHVMAKFNCRKNDNFESFYPIIGVELVKIDNDCDVLTWDYIEPWEYIDPITDQAYETTRDENGCRRFVKQPPPGERFLPYEIRKSA